MFTRKHTPTYKAVASDMKALAGRHARIGQETVLTGRADRPVKAAIPTYGDGAYAAFNACNEAYALQDAQITYRAASDEVAAASGAEGFPGKRIAGSNQAMRQADSVSAEELERKFQEFFRMGAVVAIGELYDEGMLGDKNAVAQDVCDYLDSFGVTSLDDVRALGVSGPYLQDFERMFETASFPPAA